MKNGEFTKGDLLVDPDMEVDLENGTVTACLEPGSMWMRNSAFTQPMRTIPR